MPRITIRALPIIVMGLLTLGACAVPNPFEGNPDPNPNERSRTHTGPCDEGQTGADCNGDGFTDECATYLGVDPCLGNVLDCPPDDPECEYSCAPGDQACEDAVLSFKDRLRQRFAKETLLAGSALQGSAPAGVEVRALQKLWVFRQGTLDSLNPGIAPLCNGSQSDTLYFLVSGSVKVCPFLDSTFDCKGIPEVASYLDLCAEIDLPAELDAVSANQSITVSNIRWTKGRAQGMTFNPMILEGRKNGTIVSSLVIDVTKIDSATAAAAKIQTSWKSMWNVTGPVFDQNGYSIGNLSGTTETMKRRWKRIPMATEPISIFGGWSID